MNRSSPRLAPLCLAAALAFPQAASPQASQQVPSFASKVELITVDAVVVDDAGRPVAGLTKDDFVVKEDGRPQAIASFEAFTAEAAPATAASTPIASNEAGAGGGRIFSVVFDDVGITPPLAETDARRRGSPSSSKLRARRRRSHVRARRAATRSGARACPRAARTCSRFSGGPRGRKDDVA